LHILSIALVHPTAASIIICKKWFHPRKVVHDRNLKLCCKSAFLGSVKCVCVSSKRIVTSANFKEF
jgi:hypothetical protein